MEQPASVSVIRLRFESAAFEIVSGEVVVFPAKPSKEMMTRIREGRFQVTPTAFTGSVAHDIPIYGTGDYTGALANLNLRARQQDTQWTAVHLALPEFTISQDDVRKGECRVLLPAFGRLRVIVVNNEGRTVAGIKVCVAEPGRSFCGETDGSGAFNIQLAMGQYMVIVTDGEWRQVDFRDSFEEMSMVLRQPGRSCRVLLVDRQGQPRPQCTSVWAVREEDEPRDVTPDQAGNWSAALRKGVSRSTCQDGFAYFTGLDAGTYRFEVRDQPAGAVRVKIEDFEPHTITLVCE